MYDEDNNLELDLYADQEESGSGQQVINEYGELIDGDSARTDEYF